MLVEGKFRYHWLGMTSQHCSRVKTKKSSQTRSNNSFPHWKALQLGPAKESSCRSWPGDNYLFLCALSSFQHPADTEDIELVFFIQFSYQDLVIDHRHPVYAEDRELAFVTVSFLHPGNHNPCIIYWKLLTVAKKTLIRENGTQARVVDIECVFVVWLVNRGTYERKIHSVMTDGRDQRRGRVCSYNSSWIGKPHRGIGDVKATSQTEWEIERPRRIEGAQNSVRKKKPVNIHGGVVFRALSFKKKGDKNQKIERAQ